MDNEEIFAEDVERSIRFRDYCFFVIGKSNLIIVDKADTIFIHDFMGFNVWIPGYHIQQDVADFNLYKPVLYLVNE